MFTDKFDYPVAMLLALAAAALMAFLAYAHAISDIRIFW